jgi:hypothetical protein
MERKKKRRNKKLNFFVQLSENISLKNEIIKSAIFTLRYEGTFKKNQCKQVLIELIS